MLLMPQISEVLYGPRCQGNCFVLTEIKVRRSFCKNTDAFRTVKLRKIQATGLGGSRQSRVSKFLATNLKMSQWNQHGGRGDSGKKSDNTVSWKINENDVVNVSESSWRSKRETRTNECQTDEQKFSNQEVQAAPIGNHKPVQTDEPVNPFEGQPYPPSLFAFFAKVTDDVCQVLTENEDPFLNEVFSEYHKEDEDTKQLEAEAKKLFELKDETVPEDAAALCIGWNKNGTQIAVGYGQPSHDGWCSHRMFLSVWNISRPETVNPKSPHIQLEFSSCLTAIDFHPNENNVLAVGLHSGEIALVDLSVNTFFGGGSSNEGSNTKKRNESITDVQGGGHAKQIVSLKWVRLGQTISSQLFKEHPNASSFALISASVDGYITLWSATKTTTKLYLEKQFVVSAENLGEDVNVGNRYKHGMKELFLTSLSSCKEDPTTFVFSTHGSFVFQGSLLNETEIGDTSVVRSESQDRMLYDPVANIVTEEIGLITALDCSPFHRNLFLFITSEGSCFLQNLLKMKIPTLTIALNVDAMAVDVQWSTRPAMFAVAERTNLQLYDLKIFSETAKPALELVHEEPLVKIAFNKAREDVIAVSDVTGRIHVWKLPSALTETRSGEIDELIHFGQRLRAK